MSNLGYVDLFAVEYLGLQLHRLVVNLLLGSWTFVVYLGLWHDFVFFEPACTATESEVEGRTCSSFKEKVEVVQICLKKYHTANCLNLFLI